jgi:hypothetical protein
MSVEATTAYRGRNPLRVVRRWSTSTRFIGVTAFVLFLAALHIPGRPPTLCLLRATTGIPCPFCGGTTAGVDLGHGNVLAGLRASPMAVFGSVVFVLSPIIRRSAAARRWNMLPARTRQAVAITAIITALAISEAWQLARFHLI